jgi:hypothetical protein
MTIKAKVTPSDNRKKVLNGKHAPYIGLTSSAT